MIWSDSASAPWQRRQTKDTAWTDGQFVFEAKVHNISNTLSDRNRESSERLQKELADVTAQPQFKNLQAAHTIKKPVFDVQDSLCNQLKRIGDDVFSRRRHTGFLSSRAVFAWLGSPALALKVHCFSAFSLCKRTERSQVTGCHRYVVCFRSNVLSGWRSSSSDRRFLPAQGMSKGGSSFPRTGTGSFGAGADAASCCSRCSFAAAACVTAAGD